MMATDHWDRIEELFQQALDLPQEARRGFLHERCGTDSTLLSELELLLANDLRAGNQFLEPAAHGIRLVGTATDPDRLVNQLIGAYRIVRVIARGGMGTVYLAEQAKPKRQVALKILSRGIISQSAERRFESESQILARLQHPNIAPVHEAGSHRLETGATVQYFAMEYVSDARSLTCFAKERQLKIQDRVRLFLQVCDAVHHGHQKGVIHRDLKPGNILVSSDGVVKLIDFGVARATDSDVAATSMHTDIGQLIGTLAYMSPEQCDADPLGLDIRCDVYSLGVVLYELLCGQLPYDVSKTSIFAATKAIKEAQPGRPSTIKGCSSGSQLVKGDLETIVLKCLEKERARRYASASELAADVRRYLNREPISAQPPTHLAKVVRWVLRNPRKATTATCLLIAGLVLGATKLSIWFWNQSPFEVVVTPDGKEARLNARSGSMLHAWRAAEGGVITFGELFEHSSARNNRGVVILGMSGYADPANPPGLHFYPSEGLYDQPISIGQIARNDLPASVLDKKGDISGQYGIAIARTLDVFPEIPGDEIVAGFASTFSPSPIRIYSPAGELMFEAWHDGTICDFYYLPSESLLLCAAHSSEAYWAERGQETTKTSNPLVVFAIRPQRGYQSRDYIRGDSSIGAVRCEWYKAVSVKPGALDQRGMRVPADALIWAGARKAFTSAAAPLNDGHHVQICMGLQPEIYGVDQAGIVWTISDRGQVIPGATHFNDPYSAAIDMKTVPKPEVFCLNELPPLARGPTSAATQP